MNSFERLLTLLVMICALIMAVAHTIKGNVALPLWVIFIMTFLMFRLAYKDEE